MFNSAIIEIAIGLIMLYLVLGLLCTSINEFIAQLLSLRAENLSDAIHGLFSGPDRHRIAEDILRHPLIRSLSRKQFGMNVVDDGKLFGEIIKLPSSIPATTFSTVLVDLLKKSKQGGDHHEYDKEITELLGLLGLTSTGKDLTKIEEWYDDAMDRAKSWYKRKMQVLSFMVSFGIVLVINADTLVMVDRLSNMPNERAKIVAYAANITKADTNSPNEEKSTISLPPGLEDASLSFLGWTKGNPSDPRKFPDEPGEWLIKLFGLALTAFAASLGAPFWFDLLSKFMTIRTGGDPPSGSPPANAKKGEA